MLEGKSNYVLVLFILGVAANVGDALGLFQWVFGQQHWIVNYAVPVFIVLLCAAGFCWVRAVQQEAASEKAALKNSHQMTLDAMRAELTECEKDFRRKMAAVADGLHSVTHKLRDHEHEIEGKQRSGRFDLDRLQDLSPGGGQKVADALERMLNQITGEQVNTCIRILEPREDDSASSVYDVHSAATMVFCRSAHSPRSRYLSTVQPVRGNSDFTKILWDGNDYFFGIDLDKKADTNEYANTTTKWRELYRSAIVVPIRLKISPEGQANVKYDLLGFLCADSPHPRAFDPQMEEFYADALMAAADALYLYLDFVFRLECNLRNGNQKLRAETVEG